MFCIVPVIGVNVLYCVGGMCTSFVLLQLYVYMFSIVPVIGVNVLYCASDRCT